MRSTRPQMFMDIAHVVSKRSTCMRLNVGAVVVSKRSIISIGYNGAPAGAPHCAGNDCPGRVRCFEAIHAEDNAMRHLPAHVTANSKANLDLYVTHSPCAGCCEVIASYPVSRVFFGTPYRITDHLDDDDQWPFEVYRVTPAGYVSSWPSQELVNVET